ncbi:MAG: GTPase HflX [Rhodospirillaceae bacterium]|nr:GTPase HflX [Rhodospirillaceae bacterium]
MGDLPERQRAIVLHPHRKSAHGARRNIESCLEEAVGLTHAIDLNVLHADSIALKRLRPATLFGEGTVDHYKPLIEEDHIAIVVIDYAVTPIQQRNLENAWSCKIVDRTGLILEIFGARAKTREGRLQVELAHLSYQRSRLVRSWTHLERQRGGFGFLGGPGETQIEADRRQIDDRITRIKRELTRVARTRGLHRQARKRVPYPIVALVGYTNAGKSTLFNRLTGAGVMAADQLFATLDPTMRDVVLPSGRKIIISDTVGFVSELPTSLIAAFRATLEEVLEADLILHVRDISHPDSESQKDDVLEVLEELGVDSVRTQKMLEARNKIDLLDVEDKDIEIERNKRYANEVVLSAATGDGCNDLLSLIDKLLNSDRSVIEISIPYSEGEAIAWLYDRGEVIERRDEESNAYLKVGLDSVDISRFEHRFASGSILISQC